MAKSNAPEGRFIDPAVKDYEAALKPLYKGEWANAQKLFEKVIADSEQTDLTARAREMLALCESRQEKRSGSGDDYLDALVAKNDGDFEAALKICSAKGRLGSDVSFTYLAACAAAQQGEIDTAIEHLRSAIGLDDGYRARAFFDTDLDPLHESSEFQELYEEA